MVLDVGQGEERPGCRQAVFKCCPLVMQADNKKLWDRRNSEVHKDAGWRWKGNRWEPERGVLKEGVKAPHDGWIQTSKTSWESSDSDKDQKAEFVASLKRNPCLHGKLVKSCLTLCDPMDCGLLGSSVHGDSPGKNTGMGWQALLQGIFQTQGSNLSLLHYG